MKRNIGFLNNNWKGGHRRDEYETVPLPARRVLEIKIDTLKSLLIPGVTPETSHPELKQKIADAERQLRELDEPVNFTEPVSEAEQQAREAASYEWLLKDAYMEQGDTIPLSDEHRRTDANGENAQAFMNRRFSGSDYCSELGTRHTVSGGEAVEIIGGVSSPEWYDAQKPIEY